MTLLVSLKKKKKTGQELDRLLDDDEESMWSSNPQLCYEEEGEYQSSNSNRLSIIRSPRTEEILKNVEQALRKTDQVRAFIYVSKLLAL